MLSGLLKGRDLDRRLERIERLVGDEREGTDSGARPGPRRPLLVCGTRSFAAEVADLAFDIEGFEVVGFVEDRDPSRCARGLVGMPVHWVDDVGPMAATHLYALGLTSTFRDRFSARMDALGFSPATIIHPTARVSAASRRGPGCVISAGAILSAGTGIGRHVLVNRGVLVGHHTLIGDYASLLPGANVAGHCRIGTAASVGMGALVLGNISVGAHSVVAAGSIVTRDVPDNVQVMGSPARVVKEGIDGM